MYCVIGEKVLRCEVTEKQETCSWCKVGQAQKANLVSNNRLFETDTAAREYLEKRRKLKSQHDIVLADRVLDCEALYDALYEETGIQVRVIDRRWNLSEVKRHVAALRQGKPFVSKPNKPKSFDKKSSTSQFKKDTRGSKDSKPSRDYKGDKDSRPSRDYKGDKDSRPSRDYKGDKDSRPSRDYKGDKDSRPSRDYKGDKDSRPSRDYKGDKDSRPSRDYKGNKDSRPSRDFKGNKDSRPSRDFKGNKGSKPSRDFKKK